MPARNCIVRVLLLAPVIRPKVFEVGLEFAMSKKGCFKKFNATSRIVNRTRSVMGGFLGETVSRTRFESQRRKPLCQTDTRQVSDFRFGAP